MQHLQPNSTLQGGKYIIEKTLGQGTFGITYLATHTALNRKVAIKEFFMKELNSRGDDGSISGMTDGSLSYNYGQKFKKEAINLSQLDHPNIVRVTDSFEENGTYYYVMDYIEGNNLNDYLKHNAISQQEAVSIITDVAKALQYMHDTKHMLHLDLKPGNIMRRATDGHIFLIDFGLSKHYSNSGQPETSTTIGLGTPGYAPIEQSNQAKNGEFRPTIDVYALGATLYKLLTRETPPAASDIVSDDELIEDKLRANGITGNIIDVVVNAMLPNVKKRTQTVKDFIEALNSNSTLSHTAQNTNSIHVEEVKPANEETCIIGQTNTSTEKVASVKPQAFNIDQYKIPVYFSTDPKDTVRRAIAGNEEAMFALAMMYLRGEGKFQDFDAAYRWLNTCKTNGDGRAVALLNNWEFLKKKYKKANKNPEKQPETPAQASETNSSSLGWGIAVVIVIIVIGIFCIDLYNGRSVNNSNYYPVDSDSISWEHIDSLVDDATGLVGEHEYVDLGLSVKWATCNVGALVSYESGNYYAWGEIIEKSDYSSYTYKDLKKGTKDKFYYYDYTQGRKRIAPSSGNDVARQLWGYSWRLPSKSEFQELNKKCQWKQVIYNGVKGYKITGRNNKSIFLPAAGYKTAKTLCSYGQFGDYWTSDLENAYYSWYLFFDNNSHYMAYGSDRFFGATIRPVTE